MNKITFNILLNLLVIVIFIFGHQKINFKNYLKKKMSSYVAKYSMIKDLPETNYINNSSTSIYDPSGKLVYKLMSNKIQYFPVNKVTWLEKPIMVTFNKNNIATWLVSADKAILDKDHMVKLSGHVKINMLRKDLTLKCIQTKSANINLTTQDISSEDQVIIHGSNFYSIGIKMRGNLIRKTSELFEHVQTSYYEN